MDNRSKGTRINPVWAILKGPVNNNKNVRNHCRFEFITLEVHVHNERNRVTSFSDIRFASSVPKSHDSCLNGNYVLSQLHGNYTQEFIFTWRIVGV